MNWRLIFTGVQSIGWTVSIVLAVVLATVLFVLLRKYEARLVSKGVSRTLLTLRMSVLALLFVVMLKPVLTKSWDVDRQQRLVVGFDVSESMDTADRHASPLEMLRWAQALGMLGNDSTDAILESWVSAYEAGRQPDWSVSENPAMESDPELGAIRRQHVEGVFSELGKMPRTEFVRRLLQSRPNDLLAKLGEAQTVDLRVFGIDQQSVEGEQLAALLTSNREELRPSGTDAISLLSDSIGDSDGAAIQAIVLLTDGRQTEKANAASEAARLASLGIPVYCVPIGSQLSPRDLSIASLQVPQTVFLEDTVQLRATFTSTGYVGEDVAVKLEHEGRVVDQKTVTVAGDHFDVDFGIPTSVAGNQSYTISTDVQPGELRDDNNARDFTVSVVDNKSHVMLVDGDARWEFRYLNSALERDKRVDLSTILFRQPFIQMLNKTYMEQQLPDMDVFKEQLANTDILLIGDVDPAGIPEPAWLAIEAAISDDGLTLMIIPGKRHMPHRYSSQTLQRLLPVTSFTQQNAERYQRSLPDAASTAFRLKPTPEASDLTLFQLSSDDGSVQTDLFTLPGHPWAYAGTPKSIASVWANLTVPGVDLGDAEMAAVVHQYYGFGQVVWFGVDSTWRWRYRAGDTWHHRFWGQIVRWAARNKSAAGNDQVRMTLSDVVVDETAAVDVSLRWNPNLLPQLEGGTVELVIEEIDPADKMGLTNEQPDEASIKVKMVPLDGSLERYTARIPTLRPNTYRVRLNVENSRIRLDQEVSSELIVQRQLSTELANVSCNREFLQQLATTTGGQLLEPWQLADLPQILKPQHASDNVLQEETLWDHWMVLLLFFVLLTAEWVIRKMNGLP